MPNSEMYMQPGYYWIVIGVLSAGLSGFSFWYGPHLLNRANETQVRPPSQNSTINQTQVGNGNTQIGTLNIAGALNIREASSQNEKKEAIERLIIEGNGLLERVRREYFEGRVLRTFNIEASFAKWQVLYSTWNNKCVTSLAVIYPQQVEVIRFKNAPISPMAQVGTNVKWNGLKNLIESKLKALDQMYLDLN